MLTIERERMIKVFGNSNANLLQRNGLYSVEAVKANVEKYPYEERNAYRNKHGYRYIGPVKYRQIIEALDNAEEALSK